MLYHTLALLCIFTAMSLIGGCQSTPRTDATSDQPSDLSVGYALLYELVSKQSGVGQALILGGGMHETTKELIREIAEESRNATRQIESFAEADPALRLNEKSLPLIEQKSRDAQEGHTTRKLLFSGKKFELRLLLTQVDSMLYGALLARELAGIENVPSRRDWLERFADTYEAFGNRAEERLAVRGAQ